MEPLYIEGASEHHLKSVQVSLPRNQFVVFTGISGSGKSSLAFDTLFVEGKRRYFESLSHYARQFLGYLEKPRFEKITGLSPAIAIEKKAPSPSLRSTVGTLTELLEFYRLLYARIGELHCPNCLQKIERLSAPQIVERLLKGADQQQIILMAPLVENETGDPQVVLSFCQSEGFTRVRLNGQMLRIEEIANIPQKKKYNIELVIDRITLKDEERGRLTESVETALLMGKGRLLVVFPASDQEQFFTEKNLCLTCKLTFPILSPACFSFNSPQGMCPTCKGLGVQISSEKHNSESEEESPSDSLLKCPACQGRRLRSEISQVLVSGQNFNQRISSSIQENLSFFTQIKLSLTQQKIAKDLLNEIVKRLACLQELGVGYLSLDRLAGTLSGGEFQRIHLASQLGTDLSGILYILDEPCTGLHPEEKEVLFPLLKRLQARGNSIIIVEHDRETILQAEYVVDFGPGAGQLGGNILYAGTLLGLFDCEKSLTGQYLSGKKTIFTTSPKRPCAEISVLKIQKAFAHNLKNISLEIPLGRMVCLTGKSGTGKSTLMREVLEPSAKHYLQTKKVRPFGCVAIEGLSFIQQVIRVDSTPIGRSAKSNPATYTKIFDEIRAVYATTLEARIRGYTASRFSFNAKGGRCEVCKGEGVQIVEMHFLPNVEMTCEECQGTRFNLATLEAKYKGYTIADVLKMTVTEALQLFRHHPKISQGLKTLEEVGLGYLSLGQSATSLSGGEAQRLKLSKELSKRNTGKTLYLLDEPTRGLHFEDIQRLTSLLQQLVDQGNTVILIEHHLAMIQQADFLIELGPTGGENGGHLIFSGSPEEAIRSKKSLTGKYLKKINPSV